MTKLVNANVVVIGGSSGMGLAVAKLAEENGANVTIVSRFADKLREAAKEMNHVQTAAADISIEANIQALFGKMERVDHVFISAGKMHVGKILETEIVTFRRDVEQRLWGLIYIVRQAAPKMTAGSITFITGQYSSRPAAGAVVTAALFAAAETLAKGLALELAPIRFNAISPGIVDTPILGDADERRGAAQWAKENLHVKRIGTAEEVAQAALLLMTNDFITGEILHIDGGGRLI